MAAKRYSAGAIFLQVVPVFANVQRAIEDEAKNIDRALGNQMEKSGEKAGQRAGQAATKAMSKEIADSDVFKQLERDAKDGAAKVERALANIDTRGLGKKLRSEVRQMRADLASLGDTDLTIGDNLDKVRAKVGALTEQIEDMRKRSKVFFDIDGLPDVYRSLAKVQGAIDKIDTTLHMDVDTKPAERKMGQFERSIKSSMERAARAIDGSANKQVRKLRDELEYLGKLRVGIDIGADALARDVRQIQTELDRLSREDVSIDTRLNAGAAWAELASWNAAVRRADGRTIHTHVDTSGIRRARGDADAASNSFRSFNAIILAAAGAGPALIPVLAAIAGGLFAIGPAAAVAGAGLASVLIGFSGIGDALGALSARDEQAAMGAQTLGRAAETAGRAQENAARGVADARRSAADAIEAALDQQRQAQEAYRDSVEDVKDAEEALRQARADARGQGADIKERISDNALAQDQALLDVFNATVDYNSIMADGSATNAEQEQARINLEAAKDALADLRKEGRELAKEQKEWRKEGVNGTDEVQDAQENLNTALEAQQDAYEALGEASEAVDEARADGARMVADAMRAQADAGRDAASAMEGLSSQQNAVNNAFDKLGPAGIAFTKFLYSLKDEFYAFRDDIQTAMLPTIQDAIEGFLGSKSGSVLRSLMIDLAGGFGRFVAALSQSFQGPVWLKFFQTLQRLGPDIQAAYGVAFIKFMEAMASLMTIAAPYALQFAEGLAKLMDTFAGWSRSREGRDAIQSFMGYVKDVAPLVIEFIKQLWGALVNAAAALAPYAEVVLGIITDILRIVAEMDTKQLGAILTGVIVLITASQLAYALMNLARGAVALFAGGVIGTIGLLAFAIIGVGLAFAYLWKTNEDFRRVVTKAWERVSEAIKKAWEDSIKPALEDLWDAIDELWKDVLEPFFKWLGPIILDIAEKVIPLLARAFATHIKIIAFFIRRILVPVIKAIAEVIKFIWRTVIKPFLDNFEQAWEDLANAIRSIWRATLRPTFTAVRDGAVWLWKKGVKPPIDAIEKGWDDMGRAMKWVWNNIIEPMMDFIGRKALPKLENAFESTVRAIKRIWEDLKRGVGTPIAFVIKTVLNNGIIAGFNKVAGWVNDDLKVGTIDMPSGLQQYAATGGVFGRRSDLAYAGGGVMPGYTPGRDVHHFTSPTGGRLHLSGGEAILRPEFTAAVGTGWVDRINKAAMSGGVGAIRNMFASGGVYQQAFAKGGRIVFPLPGGHIEKNYAGHDGVDINYGSGSDDLGRPFFSATSGRVTTTGYSRGYGNAVFVMSPYGELVYGHSLDGSIAVKSGQAVKPGSFLARVGSTGNSTAPHLHFGFPGGTHAAALALLQGAAKITGKVSKWGSHKKPPGWILDIVKNPLGWAKGLVEKPVKAFKSKFQNSDMINAIAGLPMDLVGGLKNKVLDIMPGWVKEGAGIVGKGLDKVGLGGSDRESGGDGGGGGGGGSYYRGGVYNGTMKYDNGGYLPPGLTSVVNLTGKPEPVFTNEQWNKMESGAGAGYHYEPHFEGSSLTAEDVAADMNFTFRRLRRGGKYAEVGQP